MNNMTIPSGNQRSKKDWIEEDKSAKIRERRGRKKFNNWVEVRTSGADVANGGTKAEKNLSFKQLRVRISGETEIVTVPALSTKK